MDCADVPFQSCNRSTWNVTILVGNVTDKGKKMPKPKVIGYTRVSTTEQVEGFGLDVQEAAIRKYCKADGLHLVAMLTDQGQSGSNGLDDRLGLAEGLARIERGEASALVVYRLDRLARDLILQETLHERLK